MTSSREDLAALKRQFMSKWLTHKLERNKFLLYNTCSAFKIKRVLLSFYSNTQKCPFSKQLVLRREQNTGPIVHFIQLH